MKLTPWFPSSKKPVNGSSNSRYQWRCPANKIRPRLATKGFLRSGYLCAYCEWRGVLKEEK